MNKISKILLTPLLFFGFVNNVFACGDGTGQSIPIELVWMFLGIASIIYAYCSYLIFIGKIKYKNKKVALVLSFLIFLFIVFFIIAVYGASTGGALCGVGKNF